MKTWTVRGFLMRLWDYYKPFRFVIGIVVGLILFKQTIYTVFPLIYGKSLDAILRKDIGLFVVLVGAWFSLRLFTMFMNKSREAFELRNLDFTVPRIITRRTLEKLFSFSVGQHVSENSGIKRSVIARGEHGIRGLAMMIIYDVIPLAFQSLIPLAFLAFLAPELALLMSVGIACFVCYTIWYSKKMMPDFRRINRMDNIVSKVSGEFISNAEVVLTSARADKAISVTDIRYGEFAEVSKRTWLRFLKYFYIGQLIHTATHFAVIMISGYLAYRGTYSYGLFVTIIGWSGSALGELANISHLQRNIVVMYTSILRFFDLIDMEPDVKMPANPIKPFRFDGRIEFKDVVFTYPSREPKPDYGDDEPDDEDEGKPLEDEKSNLPAVRGVSFTLEPGKRYAFVGRSGACKSTIVHLLLRSFDPTSGSILIDGHNLKDLDLHHWRHRVGVVPQDVTLFDETLRFNIMFGLNGSEKTLDDGHLREVSRQARIDEFYRRLEKGYDTLIGERGIRLSGGQRQRVGIARALIKGPDVLLFDEAWSQLDTENEEGIRESIQQASKGRTTIIIAHRLATVRDVDCVLVFDQGMLVGQGSHDELIGTNTVYRQLIKKQMLGFLVE